MFKKGYLTHNSKNRTYYSKEKSIHIENYN